MRFQTKPVIVEAFRWTVDEVPPWWKDVEGVLIDIPSCQALIPIPGQRYPAGLRAREGDWIIKDADGNIAVKKPGAFHLSYEPV